MRKKKRVWITAGIILLVLIALAVGAVYWLVHKREQSGEWGNREWNNLGIGTEGITGYGVTSIGVLQVDFSVENLSTGLEIEEVYVSSNQEVEAGSAVLKLSEESVGAARDELTEILKDAELAYRAGAIEYEQSKITAEYDRDLALMKGEQAKQVYEETISSLETELEQARRELQEANSQIAEYHSYVDDGTYSSYFKVEHYRQIYDENLAVLKQKMEEWNVGWSQVTSGRGGDNQYVTVLSGLYKVLEQNLKDWENAQSQYEDAIANAAFELQTLELQLPQLEKAVLEAEENQKTKTMEAEVAYETALNNAQYAEKNYQAALDKAEADFELLADTYEDAKENLELFEKSVGDGFFYAGESGNILRVMVRAGQQLTSGSRVFMYGNPEEMTVTVPVDQSQIADITVGDPAYINGTYEGVVKEIHPISESESHTSVVYDVIVEMKGDLEGLSTNQTVTVIFGALQQIPQEDKTFPGGNGEMPEGFPGGNWERPNGFSGGGRQKGVQDNEE